MKKLAIIFSVLLVITSCSKKDQFQIRGEFNALGDTTVYLNEMKLTESIAIDSTETNKKGEFKIKGTTEYPKFYQLALNKNNFINLLIKPGEAVTVKSNTESLSQYAVEGSPGSKDVQLLDQRLRKTRHKLDSLTRLYRNMETLNASEDELEEINEEYREILDQQRDSSIAFILNNLGSMSSIMALYQRVNPQTFVLYKNRDLQYIKLVADSLKEKYPESEHVKALIANKDDLMERYERMEITHKLSKISDKVDYYNLPEVKLPNLEGDSISINNVQAPMMLISFWSPSNKESVQRNLELKSIYQRYHKKGFEIYQVALTTDKEQWRKAVNFDQLPWIQVSELQGMNSYAARLYNVNTLPTEYLINRNREIIGRNPQIQELKRRLSIALD